MDTKDELKNAFFWQIGNVILFALFQLSYYAVLARLLSKTDFGIIAIANVFVSLAVLLSQIGLGPALIQRKEISKVHISTAFYASAIISIFIYGITYSSAGFFAWFYNEPILINVIKVLTLSFVFSALGSTPLSILQKKMKFKILFYVEIFSAIVGMTTGIITAINGAGVWSLVYGTLVLQFSRTVIAWLFSPVNIFIKPGKIELFHLFHFGFGLTLVRINNFLSVSGLNFILGKLLPMATLGVFERSYRIMILPGKMLSNSIDRVMFPAMSKMQDDDEQMNAFYVQNISFSLSITITASLWLSYYTKPIVLILLGSKWTDAIQPLQILFLALPFRISVSMTDSFVRAKALVYQSAIRKLIFNLVLFGLVIYSVRYGLLGIAYAVLIASVFQYFNMINLAKKHGGLSMSIIFKPFIESLPMALLMVISFLLVQFVLGQFLNANDYIHIYGGPLVSIFIFVLLLLAFVKKRPKLINRIICSFINNLFQLRSDETKRG